MHPLISNAFKYTGFVEKFGTGIPKMLDACKVDGNPKPEYKVYEKSISFVLKPSGKYMLLVGQLYGRNAKDVQLKTNAVDNNPSLNAYVRRKKLLELISFRFFHPNCKTGIDFGCYNTRY